jgi:uncharacterized protein
MIGVVLDTNIVVSAHLNDVGPEAAVVALAANGKIQLYVSETILAEYEDVLRRGKFNLSPARIDRSLAMIRGASTILADLPAVDVSPHEEDNRFIECAEAANADFLITGNTRHFPEQWKTTRIVTSRQFLSLIDF